ncbi:hypothetical protein BABINDRAFT_11464 [Babjeviella inositovora NRRL Y-12698]|uniref:Uncharacterized protein n=1 Tax=Babjeviella inositovora NRRL Y-12698 TaxID=984486 RepID=A0A1E3QZT6_9ASCO|nr:uncharacterized protein BABINDRAFT_11464 [Babjeviella inositovora NRRL Y-12698]ODQ83158.1 hypothetical protein BABINDRAFT_11464 [Babjeviella inositovora NRRL Y-12698]
MSTGFRPRRPAPSAVTAPTTVHITNSVPLKKEDVQRALDSFLEDTEINSLDMGASLSTANADPAGSGAAAYLSQLKRVQRELRGLPPMLPEMAPASEHTMNKKIRFDNNEDVEDDGEMHDADVAEATPAGVPLYANGTINKEERKRLKKERRKEEKKKKESEE